MDNNDKNPDILQVGTNNSISGGTRTYFTGQLSREILEPKEAQVAEEWNIGDVILDLYEVTDVLGEGGFGKVYKVHHKGWNMDLAVKTMRAEIAGNERRKNDFIREAEMWVEIGLHPHIVCCFYVRDLGGCPRIFTEYVEGGSLGKWIRDERLYAGGRDKALERILNISVQIAYGLKYAHEKGIVHQDVKPDNVIMTLDGEAKVTDFGISRAKTTEEPVSANPVDDREPYESHSGTIKVTCGGYSDRYCSPEQYEAALQAQGEESQKEKIKLGRGTDIWSWGVSVLEMFNGGVTWQYGQFADRTFESYVGQMSNESDPDLPKMPDGIVNLLKKCFAGKPEDRPDDFTEVINILKDVYRQTTGNDYTGREPKPSDLKADSFNNRALSYMDMGIPDKAKTAWDEAKSADSLHIQTAYNRGLFRWKSGEIDDLKFLEEMEEIHKNHPETWEDEYLIGLIHLERNDCEYAIKCLERAMEQSGGNFEVKSALKKARERLPESSKCLRSFRGHTNHVNSVFLSSDCRFALSGSSDESLRLWDVRTGKCLRSFEGNKNLENSVFLSSDCRFVLSGRGKYKETDKTFRFCKMEDLFYSESNDYEASRTPSLVELEEIETEFYNHIDMSEQAIKRSDWKTAKWELTAARSVPGYERAPEVIELWRILSHHSRKMDLQAGWQLVNFDGNKNHVESVFLSPDCRLALSGSVDNTLKLWDVQTGKCLRSFEGHKSSIRSVFLSPDCRSALSGSWDNTLKLWDLKTGKCLRSFEGHKSYVNSTFLSSDCRFALSGSWDETLKLWDVRTGKCLKTFEGHADCVNSVFLSNDFRFALSGSRDETLKLWDVQTGNCLRTFVGHKDSVNSVFLSPDSRFALSGSSDDTLKLWDISGGKCLRSFNGHKSRVLSVFLSPDCRFALSGSKDGTLKLWKIGDSAFSEFTSYEASRVRSVSELQEIETGFTNHYDKAEHAIKQKDWKTALGELSSARSMPGFERVPEVMRLWSSLSLHAHKTNLRAGWHVRSFEGHNNDVTSVFLSPDCNIALSGSWDNTLRLWDVQTGKCLRNFKGHTDCVNSIFLSPDCRFVLSGSWDKTLKLWEVQTGKCLKNFEGHKDWVNSVFLSPDYRFALSGSGDKTLKFWDVQTGKCLKSFEGHMDWVNSVSLSPDCRFALSGSGDKTLKLWEVQTGKCLRTFEGHTDCVNSVFFSSDCRFALSGSRDETLKIWNVKTGKCLRSFEDHESPVESVFLSIDCHFVLSGSGDKTIKLWDVRTGKCLRSFEGHQSSVVSVFLSPDCRFVLSGSRDKSLRIWALDWNLEVIDQSNWEKSAKLYIDNFLTLHTPYTRKLPTDREPTEEEIRSALIREGKPTWTDEDFESLLYTLGCAGYGHLRPEGVRKELEKMATKWEGPPPPPWGTSQGQKNRQSWFTKIVSSVSGK